MRCTEPPQLQQLQQLEQLYASKNLFLEQVECTMTTVALRGTLVLQSNANNNSDDNKTDNTTNNNEEAQPTWQWKGMWAFGTSAAKASAQSQQPFLYTFQKATHPSEIPIPGLIVPDEDVNEDDEDDDDDKEETASKEETNDDGDNKAKTHEKDAEATTSADDKMEVDVDKSDSKSDNKDTNDTNEKTESKETATQNTATETAETTKSTTDTPPVSNTGMDTATKQEESKEVPSSEQSSQDNDKNTDKNDENAAEAKSSEPEKTPVKRITFATMPAGHPPFTDAHDKYKEQDKPCPVSGQWKGYFQNVTTGRPQHQHPTKVQNVQETFYLFFNATPGKDVPYTFEDSPVPLPPTVHQDTLVHVRGMGTNAFGTFEIVGYLDLTTLVLEIQRQYVHIPSSPRKRRKSNMITRHKKSYQTRKRQPSWKRKSQEEQALEQQQQQQLQQQVKRQRLPKKKPDGLEAAAVGVGSIDGTTVLPTPSPTANPPTPAPPKRSSSTSRKRSSSSSVKGPAASNASSSSAYLKLPPIGDPQKARWRAAHFLYYQRHDPDLQPPATSSAEKQKGSANSTTSPTTTSATPNPRYVVYEGEMVNGLREGRGICLYSNSMVYEGEWKKNKEHGHGKLWTADRRKLIYEGEWERGRMQGQGTYYYGNVPNKKASKTDPPGGSRYIGEFKENMRNGMGQYILPDGSIYNGMWSQGKMNGRGVFTWPDHSVYDGEWKDGQRHGQGLLKTSDGFVYDGMWVFNAMEGRGMASYPNGQTYEGLFANGRREGRGTMHFTNGAVYEGRFRNDAVDGQGTMKISRALIVPMSEKDEEEIAKHPQSATATNVSKTEERKQEGSQRHDFMIPISFQSDMTHIHAKAGFTAVGH